MVKKDQTEVSVNKESEVQELLNEIRHDMGILVPKIGRVTNILKVQDNPTKYLWQGILKIFQYLVLMSDSGGD